MSKAKLELSFTHKKAHKTLIMIVVRIMMTRNLKGLLLKKRPLHLMKTNCRRYLVTLTFLWIFILKKRLKLLILISQLAKKRYLPRKKKLKWWVREGKDRLKISKS